MTLVVVKHDLQQQPRRKEGRKEGGKNRGSGAGWGGEDLLTDTRDRREDSSDTNNAIRKKLNWVSSVAKQSPGPPPPIPSPQVFSFGG